MTSIYDDIAPVVQEVMGEFKQGSINLIKITPGNGPADNPGPSTPVSVPLKAVANGVSFKYVKQGLAVDTDIMVSAAPIINQTVSSKDFIEIDSVRYKIVKDLSAPAAGTKLIWKFIVRKGG